MHYNLTSLAMTKNWGTTHVQKGRSRKTTTLGMTLVENKMMTTKMEINPKWMMVQQSSLCVTHGIFLIWFQLHTHALSCLPIGATIVPHDQQVANDNGVPQDDGLEEEEITPDETIGKYFFPMFFYFLIVFFLFLRVAITQITSSCVYYQRLQRNLRTINCSILSFPTQIGNGMFF